MTIIHLKTGVQPTSETSCVAYYAMDGVQRGVSIINQQLPEKLREKCNFYTRRWDQRIYNKFGGDLGKMLARTRLVRFCLCRGKMETFYLGRRCYGDVRTPLSLFPYPFQYIICCHITVWRRIICSTGKASINTRTNLDPRPLSQRLAD